MYYKLYLYTYIGNLKNWVYKIFKMFYYLQTSVSVFFLGHFDEKQFKIALFI